MRKRKFSDVRIDEVMPLIGTAQFTKWRIDAHARPPSETLLEILRRMDSFDTVRTEAAKLLLVDALIGETVPAYKQLKVWKGEALASSTLTGFADYLITPPYAYMKTPLLCATEAKKDNFDKGRAQCLAELVACRERNTADGYNIDLFGIVSNGQLWYFYKLTTANVVYETTEYGLNALPELLGALDYICAECAKRVPQTL